MTKREEIREGVAQLVVEVGKPNRHSYAVADGMIRYLHSQGVVIKVERELPEYAPFPERNPKPIEGAAFLLGMDIGREDMLGVGYVAIEPLIKESK